MLQIVNFILGGLTIIGQIFFFLYLINLLFFRQKDNLISRFFSTRGISFSFLIALTATFGSLFYSNIIGFAPCELCWFQRIFMYPQVFLLGLALIKKDTKIIDYSLILAAIGTTISLYHNYIYYLATSASSCGLSAASCTIIYVLEFNYVTIPLMALTAYSLIIIFLISQKKYEATKNSPL